MTPQHTPKTMMMTTMMTVKIFMMKTKMMMMKMMTKMKVVWIQFHSCPLVLRPLLLCPALVLHCQFLLFSLLVSCFDQQVVQ